MDNSRKSIILSSKQFNTQNSATPKKITTPPVSHFSNRKVYNQKNGAGVSYAQLQVILENVHQVKKKAAQQISTLQKINFKLEEELRSARNHAHNSENYGELLIEQKNVMQSKHEIQLGLLREQMKAWEQNCGRHSETILELKGKISQKESQIQFLVQQINKYKTSVQITNNKYDLITKALQVNENSNELHLVRDQYGGIPKLIQAHIESKTARKHQDMTIQELQNSNSEYKKHISQNDKVIETVTQENKYLLSMVTGMGKEKESLLANMASIEEEKSKVLKQKESTLNEIQDSIEGIRKTSDERVRQKQLMICKLKERTGQLQKQLMECQQRQRINHQEAQFKSMVDEVCDEYSDYENVIKRTQYLQKYKSEYYFNIEKIQYLCKILDS